MKTLQRLFTATPSYMKWGVTRLAKTTKLKESTVERFRRSSLYKTMKADYISKLN